MTANPPFHWNALASCTRAHFGAPTSGHAQLIQEHYLRRCPFGIESRPRQKKILQPSLWLLYQASINQWHPPVTWNHLILSIELASCEISEAFAPVLKMSLGRLFSSQMLPPEPTKISVILHISCNCPQMLSSTPARWTPPLIVMRMNICFPPQEALLPWLPLVVCDAYPRWPGWWSSSLPASM